MGRAAGDRGRHGEPSQRPSRRPGSAAHRRRSGSRCSGIATWARRRCWRCSIARRRPARCRACGWRRPTRASAEYLAEKIAQIESGEPPAGTLAETELKLRLYHGPARFDLIVKDYQGEHVTLGSDEPIQAVLRRLRRRAALPRPRGLGQPGRAPAAAAGGREPAGALHRPLRRRHHRPARRAAADEVRPRPGPEPPQATRRRPGRAGASSGWSSAVRDDPARPGPARARRGDLRRQLVRPGRPRRPAARRAAPARAWRGRSAGWPSSSRPATASSSNGSGTSRPTTCPGSRGASPPTSGATRAPTARRVSAQRLDDAPERAAGAAVAAARGRGGGALAVALAGYDAWGFHRALRLRARRQPRAGGRAALVELLAWHPSLPLFWPGRARQARLQAGRVDGQGGRGPGRQRHRRPRPAATGSAT